MFTDTKPALTTDDFLQYAKSTDHAKVRIGQFYEGVLIVNKKDSETGETSREIMRNPFQMAEWMLDAINAKQREISHADYGYLRRSLTRRRAKSFSDVETGLTWEQLEALRVEVISGLEGYDPDSYLKTWGIIPDWLVAHIAIALNSFTGGGLLFLALVALAATVATIVTLPFTWPAVVIGALVIGAIYAVCSYAANGWIFEKIRGKFTDTVAGKRPKRRSKAAVRLLIGLAAVVTIAGIVCLAANPLGWLAGFVLWQTASMAVGAYGTTLLLQWAVDSRTDKIRALTKKFRPAPEVEEFKKRLSKNDDLYQRINSLDHVTTKERVAALAYSLSVGVALALVTAAVMFTVFPPLGLFVSVGAALLVGVVVMHSAYNRMINDSAVSAGKLGNVANLPNQEPSVLTKAYLFLTSENAGNMLLGGLSLVATALFPPLWFIIVPVVLVIVATSLVSQYVHRDVKHQRNEVIRDVEMKELKNEQFICRSRWKGYENHVARVHKPVHEVNHDVEPENNKPINLH